MERRHLSLTIASVSTALLLSFAVPASADKKVDALLNKCISAMGRVKTFQADVTLKDFPPQDDRPSPQYGTLRVQRQPRRVISKRPYLVDGKPKDAVILEKGEFQTVYNPKNNRGRTFREPDWAWEKNDWGVGNYYGVIFDKEMLLRYIPPGTQKEVVGVRRIGDTVCKVLTIKNSPGCLVLRFYIAPDGTLRGHDIKLERNRQVFSSISRLTNVKVDTPIPESVFDWKLPDDVK